MENIGRLIKYLIIITIILVVAFLSQQPYFRPKTGTVQQNRASWSILTDWFSSNIYPRVSTEVAKRGAEAKEEVAKQKNVAVQGIFEQIKNYLAAQFLKFSGTEVK
jgi:hypothetical protein